MFVLFPALWLALSRARQTDETCICTGVDYLDHETYLIDGTKTGNISFASTFEGACTDVEITPTLQDYDNNQFSCSKITSGPPGSIQVSACSISYANLYSGNWIIVLPHSGTGLVEARSFEIIVSRPLTTSTAP
ncbi:hypothetical protein B0T21DRAFT_325334 [Apiosordaria backusii]|uniref:Uncharacterized protein n=1 Tax=Apiosordaria backusii TaxID=314023 RepID=A0AA40K3H9_9PEZI|nr:hypothetical protein B0T21DRAFT_325334 [Apiosordaria backusii]